MRERLRRKCFYGAASLYRLAHRFDLSDMFLKEIFIMLSYNILKSDGLPNREETEKIQIDKLLWTTDTAIKAYAQLFCGTDRLFVHLHADEKPIRAEGEGLLDEPCLDSCLEFFLSPVDKDMRYINIEMNPSFCLYFGIGTGNGDLVRILLPGGEQALNANCRRKSDFWDLYYEPPFSLIRLFFPDFKAEGSMRGNFYKCGELTEHKHYIAWNPVECETPDFRCPEYFGELLFKTK